MNEIRKNPPPSKDSRLLMLDRYETEHGPKSKIITDIKSDLQTLLGQDPLVQEIADFTEPLQPMHWLTYGQKRPPRTKKEGRGWYLQAFGKTTYFKGIGAEYAHKMKRGKGDIPGYPVKGGHGIMVEQHNSSDPEPRVIGALSIKQALFEYTNGLVLLAAMTKEKGLTSIDDVLRAKVSLPIAVASQPQLTEDMQAVIRERIADLSDDIPKEKQEKEFLSRQDPLGPLGSLGLIVPADERIGQLKDRTHEDGKGKKRRRMKIARKSVDPTIAASLGEGIRELLSLGFVYERPSAHGQNFYINGAPADVGDLLLLGDFATQKEREALLYYQLFRNASLVPPAFPRPLLGITSDALDAAQAAFWGELLKGSKVHPKAVEKIPHLLITMRDQVTMAAAQLLVREGNRARWEETARDRRKIVRNYDNYHLISHVYQTNADQNAEGEFSSYNIKASDDDPLGVKPMLAFLETGDENFLTDPKLRSSTELADAITAIPYKKQRDKMRAIVGVMQWNRFYNGFSGRYSPETNVIENAHLDLVTKNILEKRYTAASLIVMIMDAAQSMPLADVDETQEKPSKVYFAKKLLEEDFDLDQIAHDIADEMNVRTAKEEAKIIS